MAAKETKLSTQSKELLCNNAEVGEYIDFPDVSSNSPFKPNKQYFVEALSEGTAVGIHNLKEYPTFFKLFSRYIDNAGLKMKLYIRQVKPDLWLLLARKATEPKPGALLEGDFREHGRYKWYAQQLETGKGVVAGNQDEAQKVRRAWMLYVLPESRVNRECVFEGNGTKFRAFVRAKTK
jgi:hypothetical protein